jgi:PAS domain S-box-containing protein
MSVRPEPGEDQVLRGDPDFNSAILDTIASLVVVLDTDGRIIRFNKACERVTGYTASELLGKSFFEILIPEDDLPGVTEQFHRLRMGDFPNHHQNRWRMKDGSERLFEWANTAIADERGAVKFIIGTGTDVTERKRIETERDRFFELSVDMLSIASSDDGRWRRVNPAMSAVLGWTREELLAMPFMDIVHPDDLPRLLEAMADLASGKPLHKLEHRVRCRDGAYKWISWNKAPYLAEGQMYCVGRDVTERRAAEEELREAGRRKDEFLGMLSHELRNPLAPIRNSIWILRHSDAGSEQAVRAQGVIERQTEHLTRLVDDLLDVTRIARGKIELRRSRVDLREVVSRAADDFRLLMRDRAVSFHVAIPDEKLWADSDPTRITQIIGNLIHNASKFTSRGDEVMLSLDATSGQAEIRVRDTGAGIDPALLPYIFDSFVQGERTLARTEGGLGLGLALVKGIAELHGGSVRVESAGKGRGAEFIVSLPLVLPTAVEQGQRPGTLRPNGRRRVLVVDDNADAAESLAAIASLLGHVVEVAYDGPSAIEKARVNPPDLVLCDLGLPGMSGYDIAPVLRANQGPAMQLIAVSGYAQPEDVKRAMDAGFDGHVAKPVDPGRIEGLLAD